MFFEGVCDVGLVSASFEVDNGASRMRNQRIMLIEGLSSWNDGMVVSSSMADKAQCQDAYNHTDAVTWTHGSKYLRRPAFPVLVL